MASVIKTPYVTVQDQIVATNGLTNASNNINAISQRGIVNSSTVLADLTPLNGYSKISLYEPFLLPAFGSGSDCLAYLVSSGFSVGFGTTGVLNLPVALSATTTSTNVYLITYTGIPSGFNLLVNNSITGAATQGSNTGVVVSATINTSGNAQLIISSSSTFTTAAIIINYVNRSVTTPDPAQTEIVAMTLWTLFSELNYVGSQLTVASSTFPQVYLTLMGQHDTGYSPNTTAISLPVPDYVTSYSSGTTWILSYSSIPANWGLLPDDQLGSSTVTQATSLATGIFYQKALGNYVGSATPNAVCYVILNNATGTFVTTTGDTISIVLDGTQTVATMIQGTYCPYWLGYTEVTTANATYTSQFQTIIDTQNSISNVEQNSGGLTFGFLGNISQALTSASSLQQLNDKYMSLTYFPQPVSVLSLVQNTSSQVSAFIVACVAMNASPFNPMNNIISATLTAPSNSSYWIQKGTQLSSETVLQVGWTPLYINSFGQVATVRIVNSEINLPGTTTPDTEFFPFSTWQIINSWNQTCVSICKQPQYTNKRKTTEIANSLLMAIINVALTYQTNGMFSNVNNLKSLFSVQDNPTAPDAWIVNTPIQVIPELSGIQINVSIYSYLFNTGSLV